MSLKSRAVSHIKKNTWIPTQWPVEQLNEQHLHHAPTEHLCRNICQRRICISELNFPKAGTDQIRKSHFEFYRVRCADGRLLRGTSVRKSRERPIKISNNSVGRNLETDFPALTKDRELVLEETRSHDT